MPKLSSWKDIIAYFPLVKNSVNRAPIAAPVNTAPVALASFVVVTLTASSVLNASTPFDAFDIIASGLIALLFLLSL
jgi:hypothetical protein